LRPAIGISAAVELARWSHWESRAALVPLTYIDAVQRAGATALLLPPDEAAHAAAGEFLDRADALVLSGGIDIDPAMYGAEATPDTGVSDPARDRFEIALTQSALERGMPLLAICRGMEVLNVACGGTLIQHLPDRIGSDRHCEAVGEFGVHEVRLAPGSLAARAVGAERATIRSHHHQATDELGEGLAASGWSVEDEVVEAIELPGHSFCLGVLWHPEEDVQSRVIGALVEAAREPEHVAGGR
jgi:putative glutamine amidotransferase